MVGSAIPSQFYGMISMLTVIGVPMGGGQGDRQDGGQCQRKAEAMQTVKKLTRRGLQKLSLTGMTNILALIEVRKFGRTPTSCVWRMKP